MKKLTLEDLKSLDEYAKVRPQFLSAIIELKKKRRLSVGDRISLIFENRDTVLFQIQEMARVEGITSPEKLQHEIDTYNVLIPEKNMLKATFFIEITNQEKLKEELSSFIGIEEGCCSLLLGEERLPIQFEEGHSQAGRISAVHYVTIPFTEEQKVLWKELALPAKIRIEHPNYRAIAAIPEEMRKELIQDLENGN